MNANTSPSLKFYSSTRKVKPEAMQEIWNKYKYIPLLKFTKLVSTVISLGERWNLSSMSLQLLSLLAMIIWGSSILDTHALFWFVFPHLG
jgi:hypothetical protein